MKKNLFIAITVIILVFLGYIFGVKPNEIATGVPQIETTEKDTKDETMGGTKSALQNLPEKSYTDPVTGISFNYNGNLNLKKTKDGVELKHSVKEKNTGICSSMKGSDENGNVEGATDFLDDVRMNMYFFDKNASQVLDSGVIQGEDKSEITIAGKKIVYEWNGLEGCGIDIYYIPIANNRSMVIEYQDVNEYEELRKAYTGNPVDKKFVSQKESYEILENIIKSIK
jgi:hypothetical protein